MNNDFKDKSKLKSYVFLTDAITYIGGGQIYTANKTKYLIEKGWDVSVYSTIGSGEILISELESHKEGIYPILRISPSILRKKLIETTIEKILQSINSVYSEICIECHSVTLALWGELLARALNAKCFIYLLSESFGIPSIEMIKYFSFKFERMELAGISRNSLSLLFKNQKEIAPNEQYFLSAGLGDVVSEIKCDFVDTFERGDIIIGSVGRLNKGYVPSMIDDIIEFAKINPHKMIQLILVGDSENSQRLEDIESRVRMVLNLSVFVLGGLFPLPKSLLNLFDLNIGSAGSARLAAFHGIPTIALDAIDYQPIGILGFETNSSLYREGGPMYSLPETIQKIVDNLEYYKKIENWKIPIRMSNPSDTYDKHMDFLNNSDQTKEYFRFSFKNDKLDQIIRKYLIAIIGVSNYLKLINNTKFKSIYVKVKQWCFQGKKR